MFMTGKFVSLKLAGALFVLGFASVLSAQLNSGSQAITVTASTAESISIAINSGGTVHFAIPGPVGSSAGSVVPSWTTSWVLNSSRTSVKVYAYFIGSVALTGTNPSNTIPGAAFLGQANGGSATPFNSGAVTAVTPAGAGMLVSTTAITGANLTSSKTDSLAMTLAGLGVNTPYVTDTYTGVLNIQAQATP
jgi:hypothetical protein